MASLSSSKVQLYAKFPGALTPFMEMKRSALLSDVTLVCYGKEIRSHRIILAGQSNYFLTMFTSPFKEQKLEKIEIHGVDLETLEALVEFCYSGQILLTDENVQKILGVADMFQMENVVNAGCEYLETQLHPSNVLGVHNFAKYQNFPHLLKSADDFRRTYFQDVVYHDEFQRLPVEELSVLIASPRLTIQNEDQVLKAVLDWVKFDPEERVQFLPKLLGHVRLVLVDREFWASNMILQNDPISKDIYENPPKADPAMLPVQTVPRKPAGQPLSIIVFSGEVLTTQVHVFDNVDESWNFLPSMPVHYKRTRAQVVACSKKVYLLGGYCGDSLRTVQVFDLETQRWTRGPTMKLKRCSFAGVCFNSRAVALGGLAPNPSRSVESFDPVTQRWTSWPPLREERAYHAAGVFRGTIYVVGGVNSMYLPVDTAEYYDSTLRTWVRTSNMNCRRSGAGVAVLNDRLYAIGGSDRFTTFDSVEVFNPDENKWTQVCRMNKRRRLAGVVIHNNRIVVIGGDDHENGKTGTTVEVYDPIRDRWWLLSTPTACVGIHVSATTIPKYF